MMLRLILLGLVTSMSLELPSGQDVSGWVESGRAWANTNLCELAAPEVEVVTAPRPVVACLPAEADLAFQAVSGEMAADFAADRAVVRDELPAGDVHCDVPTTELVGSVAVGLPDGEELATAIEVVRANEPGSIATSDQPALEVEDDTTSRADRLASAVRLTREAAQAWAALVQESADETNCGR